MTKMAAMLIYMVKTFKNLLSQNRKSYDLETWHAASGTQLYKVYINDDPGLTSTYILQGQIGSPIRLNGENCYKVIKW